jgi:hypothetical protein
MTPPVKTYHHPKLLLLPMAPCFFREILKYKMHLVNTYSVAKKRLCVVAVGPRTNPFVMARTAP